MKFLKRLFSKRNKAGFTLIEVVISVGLMGVQLVSMMLFTTPVLKAASENKKDNRATILAETLESYIDRNTKYAEYFAVFTGVAINGAQRTVDLQNMYQSEALQKFRTFMNDNSTKYQVRCISINWQMDQRTNQAKYMLNLNKVADGTGGGYTISKVNPVFDDCFYEALYPTINIEQVISKTTALPAAALKISVDIFSDAEMNNYSTRGEGYVSLLNVELNASKNPNERMFFNEVRTPSSDELTDTYIFYITRNTF